jgi:PAS domain S-box-containing protein
MPERILLIEDDIALQGNLFEILSLKGFYVEAFSNPLIALERFNEFKFDLILCDNLMKEINGIDVLIKLRTEYKSFDVPFIMITAYDDKSILREAMRLGADDFIGKPFSADDLLNAIFKQIEKYTAWKRRLEALANFPNENPSPVTRVDNSNYSYQYSNPEFIKRYEGLTESERISFNQFIKQNSKEAFTTQHNINKSYQIDKELFNVTFSTQIGKGYTNIYFSDITPLKLAEEKITKQEEFYKEILDNIPADLGVFSPDHVYLYVNPQGIKDNDIRSWIIGKTDEDYIRKRRPDNMAAFERRRTAFLEAKKSMSDTIFMDSYQLKNGDQKHVLRKFHPVKNEKNEIGLVIGYGVDITERVLAEQKFEKSRQKYKALFDSNPQMVFIIDNLGRIVDVNISGVIQLGYSYNELIGELVTKLFPLEYHSAFERTIEICFEQSYKEHEWELIKTKRDGSFMNVFEVARCIKLNEIEEPVLLVVCTDITEKKKNENLLQESSEFNKMLLEEMPVPVAIIDRGIIKDVNIAFCDLFCLGKDAAKEKRLYDFVDPEYHQYLSEKIAERYSSIDKVMNCEVLMQTDKDTKLNVLINGTLFKNKGEVFTLAVFNNITSIRHAEEREKAAEYRSKAILNSSLDAIILIDEEGLVIEWNKQAEIILGYSIQEAFGKPLEELIIPERYRQKHKDGMEQFKVSRHGPALNKILELPALHKDGHELPVELFIVAIEISGKQVFSAFIRNIEERKKSETNLKALAQELSKQNEDLKRFAYITSHDLRAPVINLNALMDYYDAEDPASDLNKDLISKFKSSAERILDTLNDLLEVTRVKDRTQNEEKSLCNVFEIFNNCVEDNWELLKGISAVIIPDFCKADEIFFAKSVINSVFTNLITNSVKYSSSQRGLEIKISTRVLYGKYVISFSDNGMGMDMAKTKNRLFTLYQRFHNHVEGKGLGLYLVKSQLEALGSSLSVQSQENVGTEFTISIPI